MNNFCLDEQYTAAEICMIQVDQTVVYSLQTTVVYLQSCHFGMMNSLAIFCGKLISGSTLYNR